MSRFQNPTPVQTGAAVSDWISYGTSLAGWNWTAGTGGSYQAAYYRRVGSVMNIRAGLQIGSSGSSLSGNLTWTLPTGFTIDTSKVDASANDDMFGAIHVVDGGVGHKATGVAVYSTSTAVQFLVTDVQVSPTQPFTWAAGDGIWMDINVPIAEWAGSGTVNLGAGAQVQYLFNSGSTTTAGTSDTSSFGYGPAGTPILSYNSTTSASSTSFRVRSQYPIQANASVTLELGDSTGTYWTPMALRLPPDTQGPFTYGAQLRQVNSTDFDVYFNNGGTAGNSATYSQAGQAWSVFSAANLRWRVVVYNPSSPVGFGLATSNTSGLVRGASAFAAYASVNQGPNTSGTAIKVSLNVEEFDTDNQFDNITNYRFTPAAGTYLFTCNCTMNNAAAVNTADVYLYKNGNLFKIIGSYQNSAGTTGVVRVSGSVIVQANGTDYFEMYAAQVGSGNWTRLSGQDNTYMSAARVY